MAHTLRRAIRFWIDGVPHRMSDAAVLERAQREAFPGTIRWSIELAGADARRLSPVPYLGSRPVRKRPNRAVAEAWLGALRPLLLRPGSRRPRFVLCTIDHVEIRRSTVRLTGTCAPIVTEAALSATFTR